MAAPVVIWAGAEDSDYDKFGAGLIIIVDTTSGRFTSTFSRCALTLTTTAAGQLGGQNQALWTALNRYSTASAWWSFNLFNRGNGGAVTGSDLLRWSDTAGVTKLRLRCTSAGIGLNGSTFVMEKVTTSGTGTQLGSSFTIPIGSDQLGRLDVQIVYNASGSIAIYAGGTSAAIYSVTATDLTTDGNTTLCGHSLGTHVWTSGASLLTAWSQTFVADTDTRSWQLQTLAPVANGNTHNFDVGTPAAANVNEVTLNDGTLDGALSAGLIDQYTIPALAAGTWGIPGVGVSARTARGASGGPTKYDLGFRSGGADNWSTDFSPGTSLGPSLYMSATDPATGIAWAALPTNIGMKAVA